MSTELINPDIERVDAVNGPATGIPFLIFKSADGAPAPESGDAPAAEVAKSSDDAEELAEEVADAEAPNIDGAPVDEETAAAAEPGDAAWEAVDAAKARVAVSGLAALSKLVAELQTREAAEGTDERWNLADAGDALDFALGVLARFSVTEQMEADDAAEDAEATARALGIIKALHLEVHEKPEEPAPAAAPAPVEDSAVPEAPAPAEAPAEGRHAAPAAPVKPEDVLKAAEGVLPAGLMELLSAFVEGYSQFTEAEQSGAEDELNADDVAPTEAAAPAAPAPVEDAQAPEAPAAHEAPAEPHHTEPAAEAPKAEEEDPAEKFKKSMQAAIAEAVEAATAPLRKQIDVLERTPVDSGPMLAGQTPGMAGTPLVRGQEEGAVAKGLNESAAAQAAPGTNALAEAIKGIHAGLTR